MKSKRTVSLVLPLAAAVFAALSPAPAAAESMSAAADAAVAARLKPREASAPRRARISMPQRRSGCHPSRSPRTTSGLRAVSE